MTAVANRRFADSRSGVAGAADRRHRSGAERGGRGGGDPRRSLLARRLASTRARSVRASVVRVYAEAVERALATAPRNATTTAPCASVRDGTTLLRPDGTATYQLASVADDLELGDHARDPRLGPPPEPPRAAAHRARARRRAAGGHPPRARARAGREEALEAPRPLLRSPSSARKVSRLRQCARTSTSSTCPSTTCSSTSRGLRRLAVDAIAAMPDEELAAAADAPVESSRRFVERARSWKRASTHGSSPSRRRSTLGDDARPTLERFAELRGSAPDRLSSDEARAIVRELKAVGGDLRVPPARAHRRRARPGARGRARRGPARRGTCARVPRTRCLTTIARHAPVRHAHALAASSCRLRPARSGSTGADRPSTSASMSATPLRSRSCRCGSSTGSRRRGYETKLVVNITDINDKIYDAAPGASAQLASRRDALVRRGHRSPGSRPPRRRADGRRDGSRPDRDDRGARRARLRVRVRGRRLLSRHPATPSTGGSAANGPTRSRSRSRTRARRTRATSRCGRRTSRARTRAGTPLGGAGGPGWHIECSVMSEKHLGPSSRSTAAGSISCSRTTRTRSRSPERSDRLSRGSGCTTACCGSRARRCTSRSETTSP